MKVQIAMAGLFGSLFFSLLPMYDILRQQNNSLHPLIWILSILLLLLTIISAMVTSKKLAYITHNLSLTQKKHSLNNLPIREKRRLTILGISTFLLFTTFLYVKITVLHSVSFFFKTLFGSIQSIPFSTLLFLILLWSFYILIRAHLDDQYPNIWVDFQSNQSTN